MTSLRRQQSGLNNELNRIESELAQIPSACHTARSQLFTTAPSIADMVRSSRYGSQLGSDRRVTIAFDSASIAKVCEIAGFRTVAASTLHRVSSCRDNPMAIFEPGSNQFVVKGPCEIKTLVKRLSCTDRFRPVDNCSNSQLSRLDQLQAAKTDKEREIRSLQNSISAKERHLSQAQQESRDLAYLISNRDTEARRLNHRIEDLESEARQIEQQIFQTQADLAHAREELRRARNG